MKDPARPSRRARGPGRVLEVFVGAVTREFGQRVKEIRLFGSRARGDNSKESDYDLLVIVDQMTPEVEDGIEELGTRLLLDHRAVISTFVFSEADLQRLRFEPFIMNIQRESVRIA